MTTKAGTPTAVVPYSKASSVGLLLPTTLDEKRWIEIGDFLSSVDGSVRWWIGDWWAFGEHKYGDRKEIAEAHGWNVDSCMNAGAVSRAVETSRRREVLSWSHHAEVAAMESAEQDRLLADAEREGWGHKRLRSEVQGRPHVSNNSGDNEWYTPEQYVGAAREVLGAIDLDPASSDQANETVQAERYFTAEDNGLDQEWAGRVWMNPPYAGELIGKFADKMATAHENGTVDQAIVLVNNATETAWFQRLARTAKAICFPERRVRFWNAEGELGAPLQGQAFLYLGDDSDQFAERFAEFGIVVEVRSA